MALRQVEHPLAENVVLHFAGAAADGGRVGVHRGTLPFATLHRLGVAHVEVGTAALQLDGEIGEPAHELRSEQLAHHHGRGRALRRQQLFDPGALAGQRDAALIDQKVEQLVLDQRILQCRAAVTLDQPAHLDHILGGEDGGHVAAGLTAGRATFEGQHRHRHQPALAFFADQGRFMDAGIGEDGLIEAVLAGDLFDRDHLDAGRLHRAEKEAEAGILVRRIGVGARQQNDVLGLLTQRGPDLAAIDDVVAAGLVAHGTGLHIAEVGAVIGFGETLTPDFAGLQNRPDVLLLLRLGAMLENGRAGP